MSFIETRGKGPSLRDEIARIIQAKEYKAIDDDFFIDFITAADEILALVKEHWSVQLVWCAQCDAWTVDATEWPHAGHGLEKCSQRLIYSKDFGEKP
jgi:hypothetical protein